MNCVTLMLMLRSYSVGCRPALKGRSGGPAANRSATGKIKTGILSRPQGRVFTPLRSYEGQWLRGRRLRPLDLPFTEQLHPTAGLRNISS